MDSTSRHSSGRRRPLGQEGGRQDPVGQRSQERQSGSRHRDLPTDAEGVPDGGVVEGRARGGEPPDGLAGHADHNAAINIAVRAGVNRPIVAGNEGVWGRAQDLSDKPPILIGGS